MPNARLMARARVLTVGTIRLIAGGGVAAAVVVIGLQVGNVPHGPQTVDAAVIAPHWRDIEAADAHNDAAAEIRMSAIRTQDLKVTQARADRDRRIRAE